jgi:hypothetical protein
MTVSPATWEAEMGGSKLKANLGKKISEFSSQLVSQMWWPMSVVPATWEAAGRRIAV